MTEAIVVAVIVQIGALSGIWLQTRKNAVKAEAAKVSADQAALSAGWGDGIIAELKTIHEALDQSRREAAFDREATRAARSDLAALRGDLRQHLEDHRQGIACPKCPWSSNHHQDQAA